MGFNNSEQRYNYVGLILFLLQSYFYASTNVLTAFMKSARVLLTSISGFRGKISRRGGVGSLSRRRDRRPCGGAVHKCRDGGGREGRVHKYRVRNVAGVVGSRLPGGMLPARRRYASFERGGTWRGQAETSWPGARMPTNKHLVEGSSIHSQGLPIQSRKTQRPFPKFTLF